MIHKPERVHENRSASNIAPAIVVIFGASGDLTQRKLLPALHSLSCSGHLPSETHVLGVGRTVLSSDEFRHRMYEGIETYARIRPEAHLCELWSQFEARVHYETLEQTDPEGYTHLSAVLDGLVGGADASHASILFYLAVPPEAAADIVSGLVQCGLIHKAHKNRRVIIEKPFGHDLADARHLNRALQYLLSEDQIYRIDHYLGKETVQNILSFRFANTVFEPLWTRDTVDHVQITIAESLGVEGRGKYYDQAGILRDIVQNHLLQLVALTALEPPISMSGESLRDEKVRVFDAIRCVEPNDVVLGQYGSYRDEHGVCRDSQTPTYAALRLWIDNERWRGVPFYIRTGKSLAAKETEISLAFKAIKRPLLSEVAPSPNSLSLRIQPDEGIRLHFETKIPGANMRTQSVDMTFDYSDQFGERALADAYERLLLDALRGDNTLFIRDDEIESCWRLIDPLLGPDPRRALHPYAKGSWGPAEAQNLFGHTGRTWLRCCSPQAETP